MSMIPLSKGKSHSFTNNYKKDLIEENSHISKLFRTKSFALFNQEEEEDPEMNGQSNNYINDYDEKFFEDEFKGECKGAKTYGGKVNSQEWKASPRMSSLSSEISLKISENIKKIKRDLTEETSELILNSLKKNCIFSYTSETHMF